MFHYAFLLAGRKRETLAMPVRTIAGRCFHIPFRSLDRKRKHKLYHICEDNNKTMFAYAFSLAGQEFPN